MSAYVCVWGMWRVSGVYNSKMYMYMYMYMYVYSEIEGNREQLILIIHHSLYMYTYMNLLFGKLGVAVEMN